MTNEVKELEKVRKARSLAIVSFVGAMPIARSTYYGWLKGRCPDPYRMSACLKIARRLKGGSHA